MEFTFDQKRKAVKFRQNVEKVGDVVKNPKETGKKLKKKVDKAYEDADKFVSSPGDAITKTIIPTVLKKPGTSASIVAPGGTALIATGVSKKVDKVSKLYKGDKIAEKIQTAADNEKTGWGKIRKSLNSAAQKVADLSRSGILMFSDKKTQNMIKYRQGMFTIPEGHYTGPKDLDEVPGTMKVVGGATLGGAVLGGIAGHVLGEVQDKFDADYKKGAKIGAGAGLAAGIAAKVLLNVMHNPMTTVKFNEVDKTLRRSFGIYSASGFTVGDSRDNRKKFDEAFATNDRNVTDYRINVVIQDNQVILYTFQLSDKELKTVSDSLDYYCKKYYGMNYNSKVIDAKINAYSVTITFTNYQVISDFLMEVSDELKVKINLLNNKAIVDLRLKAGEKDFSDIDFNNYDLMKIFLAQGVRTLFAKGKVKGEHIMEMISDAKESLSEAERVKIFGPSKRKDFDNAYLLGALSNLRFTDGKDYTVDVGDKDVNMALFQGNLTIAVQIGTKPAKALEDIGCFNKSEVNKTIAIYTYSMKSKQDLNTVITKVINTRIIPNIYTGN
jgi:hypothetical protein